MLSNDKLIQKTVYEFFKTRILSDYYHTGEKLPSIVNIAGAFRLAPGTIRAALLMLEADGYIEVEAKQGSRVIYHAEPLERMKNQALFYAQRHDGIRDLLNSGTYLLQPILIYGLQTMSEECWDRLAEDCGETPEKQIMPASIRFYGETLSTLNNSLILNLFWEANCYFQVTYLSHWNIHEIMMSASLINDRQKRTELIESALYDIIDSASRQLLSVSSRAREQYPQEAQLPFCWTIYRQRHQLCYTLAARIIRKIAAGVYPKGSYLPPLWKMSEQLGVSLRTLRRAISILGSLGVTCSFQGSGTLVCMETGQIDYSRPEIKEGLRYYWESLQLLALTVRPVTLYTLQNISEEERAALTEQFVRMCALDQCEYCFDIVLNFIAERCPLAMARECYGKLQEFLAWGYPFVLYRLRDHSLQSEYAQVTRKAADCLEHRAWEAFAAEYEALMLRETRFAETILAACRMQHSGHLP